eukprot:8299281-Alexandrium_andersonii.AAC.1
MAGWGGRAVRLLTFLLPEGGCHPPPRGPQLSGCGEGFFLPSWVGGSPPAASCQSADEPRRRRALGAA